MLIILCVFRLFDIKRFYFQIQEMHQIHGCFSEKSSTRKTLTHEYAQVENVRCLVLIKSSPEEEKIEQDSKLC
jgi:hypothetical protein